MTHPARHSHHYLPPFNISLPWFLQSRVRLVAHETLGSGHVPPRRTPMSLQIKIASSVLALLLFGVAVSLQADFFAMDPGVRGGPAGAGGPIHGISDAELAFFKAGLAAFNEIQDVQGDDPGLGPRFNLDSCAGCHKQPEVGGSSPFTNTTHPQIDVATKNGATNVVPSFIRIGGPVREARFKFKPDGTRDGGVHNLFTIT